MRKTKNQGRSGPQNNKSNASGLMMKLICAKTYSILADAIRCSEILNDKNTETFPLKLK